jgi:hypothetical protein
MTKQEKVKPDWWKGEWKDMPEFVQEKKSTCYSKIIVRFESEEDLQDFARLINQTLTSRTKSIWHPYKSHWGNSQKKEYVDES